MFLSYKFYVQISFLDLEVNGSTSVPASQIPASVVLLLREKEIKIYQSAAFIFMVENILKMEADGPSETLVSYSINTST
jgi:hypothetical protein